MTELSSASIITSTWSARGLYSVRPKQIMLLIKHIGCLRSDISWLSTTSCCQIARQEMDRVVLGVQYPSLHIWGTVTGSS